MHSTKTYVHQHTIHASNTYYFAYKAYAYEQDACIHVSHANKNSQQCMTCIHKTHEYTHTQGVDAALQEGGDVARCIHCCCYYYCTWNHLLHTRMQYLEPRAPLSNWCIDSTGTSSSGSLSPTLASIPSQLRPGATTCTGTSCSTPSSWWTCCAFSPQCIEHRIGLYQTSCRSPQFIEPRIGLRQTRACVRAMRCIQPSHYHFLGSLS